MRSFPAALPASTRPVESSRQPVEQQPEREQRAAEVDRELHEVGPQHRAHAADVGVDDGGHADEHDRPRQRDPGHLLQHDGGEEQAQAVRQRAGDDEQRGGDPLCIAAEAARKDLVRGEQLAAEVVRQQQVRDGIAAEQEAECDLQPRHVAREGEPRDRQERHRARLGGDDREEDQPPRQVPAPDHEIGGGPRAASHPHPEQDNPHQVDGQNRKVDRADAHASACAIRHRAVAGRPAGKRRRLTNRTAPRSESARSRARARRPRHRGA